MKGRNQKNYSPVRPPPFQTFNPQRSKLKVIKQGRDIYDSDSEYEMKKEETHLKNLKLEETDDTPLKKISRTVKKPEEQDWKTKVCPNTEKKPDLKLQITQNFDNYYPQYSEDEQDSYDEQNEDSDQQGNEFGCTQKVKQMKINTKKKQPNNQKQEPVTAQVSKRRKKKKKRRVVLNIILGAKQHIDSVDPFLKNTYNTVSQSRRFISNLKQIAQRVESGQEIFFDNQQSIEMRVTPTIIDFIQFCQDSNRKGIFLVCDSIINYFHLYFAKNDMGIIGLIDENLLPFTQSDKLPIYDEKDFEDSLYNNILFRQIVCLDENPDRSDDFATTIRLQARNKISQLAQLLSHGYIVVKNDRNINETKIKKQLPVPVVVNQFAYENEQIFKVDDDNDDEQLKIENLLFDDYFNENDERELNFFSSNDQRMFTRQQDLYEESQAQNQFLF